MPIFSGPLLLLRCLSLRWLDIIRTGTVGNSHGGLSRSYSSAVRGG